MHLKKRGFSIIELLIAIFIISLLSLIVLSNYKNYQIMVRNKTALYDLKNLINDEISHFAINQNFVSFSVSNVTQRGIIIVNGFEHKYLSKHIRATAKVNGKYANFCVKHTYGNKIYAYQSENDMIYWKESPKGHELQDSDCPNATPNDDFSGWHVLAQKR